jgi:hypothetical protein
MSSWLKFKKLNIVFLQDERVCQTEVGGGTDTFQIFEKFTQKILVPGIVARDGYYIELR